MTFRKFAAGGGLRLRHPSRARLRFARECRRRRAAQSRGSDNAAGSHRLASSAPILLETIEPAELREVELERELGCAFHATRSDAPLFVSPANVTNDKGANGLVHINGEAMKLTMTGTGGYDRMADGACFTADQLSAVIEVTGSGPIAETRPSLPNRRSIGRA